MLGKLLKYDFAATWKVTVGIDAGIIALGIITGIITAAVPHVEGSLGISLFMFAFVGLFYIGIIAANVGSIIYLVVRYYKSMYTAEGYLTFTLPVKTDNIVHSKVITGAVWIIASYLSTFIAMFLAGTGLTTSLAISGEDIFKALREAYTFLGLNSPGLITTLIIIAIISPIGAIVSMYFCVSIGQLWQNHKILGSVLCIIGLYVLNQLISQAVFAASGFWQLLSNSAAEIDASFGSIYTRILQNTCIATIIETAIYYAVTLIINRKKVNLD